MRTALITRTAKRVCYAGAGAWVCASLCAAGAAAQNVDSEASSGIDRGIRITTGVRYESFDEDRPDALGQRLGQLNVYGNITTLFGPSLRADFASGWNATNWHSLGDLSTLDDSQFELSWRPTEHAMLGGGINLPTGHTKLDLEQARLAQGISSRLKGYRVSEFGTGTDLNARASYGVRAGRVGLVAGAGWLVKGHYTIFAGQGEYDPGDQVTLSLGTDIGSADRFWRTTASYTLYARDEIDGRDAFEFGNRLRVETAYRQRTNAVSFLMRVRGVFREDNKRFAPEAVLAAAALEDQGAELYADQTTDLTLHGGPFGLLLLAGARVFEVNDRGIGSGHRIDAGGGLRVSSKTMAFVVTGRGSFGRVDVTDIGPAGTRSRHPFTGWSVDGSLTRRAW